MQFSLMSAIACFAFFIFAEMPMIYAYFRCCHFRFRGRCQRMPPLLLAARAFR